jgi:hypothetical protein
MEGSHPMTVRNSKNLFDIDEPGERLVPTLGLWVSTVMYRLFICIS